uniref:Uncharacterized protein n=1 Tax=Pithovirus LCPAC304 TaxID=2506594 RepID=A0A481Z9T7_9VIRU|nr:MAG: hypothetical protein LCPAC304_01980 [Pithovirus LCPAC304]
MEDTLELELGSLGSLYQIMGRSVRIYVFQKMGQKSFTIVPNSVYAKAVENSGFRNETPFYKEYQEYGRLCPRRLARTYEDFIVTSPIPISKEVLHDYFGTCDVHNKGPRTYSEALDIADKMNPHNILARRKKENDDFWGH